MSSFKEGIGIKSHSIQKINNNECVQVLDQLAIEAPLLINLNYPGVESEDLVITMQTPIHSEDLIVGFLYTEGVIESRIEGV